MSIIRHHFRKFAVPCARLLALFILVVGLVARVAAQNVTLTDNGSSVIMSNGVIAATFAKSSGYCTDLRLYGGANLLANGGKLYFDANGSITNGASAYFAFSGDLYRVITNTTSRVEIAMTDTNLTGFNAELHYSLRGGDPGFHVFTVWRHGAGQPVAMLEQSRTVLRCDPNVFTLAFTSTNKTGQMVAPSLLNTNISPAIMDATQRLPLVSSYTNATGYTEDYYPVYTKYDWAEYTENLSVCGLTSQTQGLWMIFGGTEYFNGGPTRANLIVHGTDTTPLILWDFHAQHFGGAKINKTTNEVWSKLCGPAFVYVNTGATPNALWQDAQARAASEQSGWPCTWLSETNYPVARGVVSGQLHILGESAANTLLVLAQPGTNWQFQSDGYIFWSRAAANGNFTIPKVRAGTYCLFARVPGIVGETELTNVTVTAGATNDLGVIERYPPRREQRLWRVGTPDLSAGEFRFGSDMRQFGYWWRYLEEQGTNNLVYRIGTSTATNWYNAQCVVALDGGTYFSPIWEIQFVLTNLPPSPAVLTVDLAGAIASTLIISVNGTTLSNLSVWSESSITRSATRSGTPRHHEFSFSPSLLQVGTNRVQFTQSKSSSWSGTKPVAPNRGVLWDCIQLEAGPLLTNIAPQFASALATPSGLVLSGSGGVPDGTAILLGAATLGQPVSPWTPLATNRFDGRGNFAFTNAVSTGTPQLFYRLQVP